MKKIILNRKNKCKNNGFVALIDDEDYNFLNQFNWTVKKHGKTYYAIRNIDRKEIAMHRFITQAPKGMDVDHVNRNGLDNQRFNLKICTHLENMQNLGIPKNQKNGHKGIRYDSDRKKKKWRSFYKNKTIGRYTSIEEAIISYDNYIKKYYENIYINAH